MRRSATPLRARLALAACAVLILAGAGRARADVTESEPNDSIPQANTFTIGEHLFGDFSDAMPPSDDYFAFSATAGNSYLFVGNSINCLNAAPSPSLKEDLGFEIHDGSDQVIASQNSAPTCLTENFGWVAPSTGTFYLVVYEARAQQTLSSVTYRIDTYVSGPTPSPSSTPLPTFSPSPTPSPSPSPTPYMNQGTGRDVPTWELGYQWDYNRAFSLDVDLSAVAGLPLAATLDVTETYRMTVTAIQDELTTIGGIPVAQRVYVRDRSNGTVAATGLLSLSGTPLATLSLSTTGTLLNQGQMWTRVSDLADAHEEFRLVGTLEADFLTTTPFRTDLAAIDITLNIDHDPPVELADFPLDLSGEQWNTNPTRRIHGQILADFPTLGSTAAGVIYLPGGSTLPAPADAALPFDITAPLPINHFYEGPDAARQGYNPAYHSTNGLSGGSLEEEWYAPGAKEFVERALPTALLGAPASNPPVVRNFRTTVAPGSAVVTPDTLSALMFVPARPLPSQSVTLYGHVTIPPPAGTTVTAKILDTGATASNVTDAAGDFAIFMTAPPADDTSPASLDGGSYGVEIAVQGFTARKVVSMQLGGAGITPVSSWEMYE